MKKIFVVMLFLPLLNLKGQSFEKSQVDLNLGLGLGNSFARSGAYRSIPVINASLEVGITDAISLGGYLGFAGATWRYSGTAWCNNGANSGYYNYEDEYRWSFFLTAVRCGYHFAEFIPNDKIDLYLGLMLGNNYARYTFHTSDPCPSHVKGYGSGYGGFFWSGYAGCRYRFTDKIGAFAELGYGVSYLNVGVNFKLK